MIILKETCIQPLPSLPRCCCIYSLCFLYTPPAEKTGTVHHKPNGMGTPAWLPEVSYGLVEGIQRALSFFSGSSPVWLQHLRLTLSLITLEGAEISACAYKAVCSRGLGNHFAVDPAFSVSLSAVPLLYFLFDFLTHWDRWTTKRSHSYER